MADLTQDKPLRFRYPSQLRLQRWVLDNSAAQTIYRGQPIIIDASADTVYVRGWKSTTTLVTATDVVIGIANEAATVATTDVEASNEIEVITGGEVGFQSSVFTDADVGKSITFSDSGTLSTSAEAADKLPIGTLERVADGFAYIKLNTPHIMTFS